MGIAIDVSHHQNPASLPWDGFAGHVDAVIARACYGSELRDRHAREHVRRARAIGATVGLYVFFRPTQPVRAQFDLFCSVADSVLLGPGDIVPALDIERDPFPKPGHSVHPAWLPKVEEFIGLLDERFDAKAMVYITRHEFNMLGAPAWMLAPDRPVWVAHYTAAPKPATPGGRDVVLWQHRVAPFDPNGPGGYDKANPMLDQNRILAPLPLLGPQPSRAPVLIETPDDGDDFDDYDDERIEALTLSAAEVEAIDAARQDHGGDAVRAGLRGMSGHDTEPAPPPDDAAPDTLRDPGVKRS